MSEVKSKGSRTYCNGSVIKWSGKKCRLDSAYMRRDGQWRPSRVTIWFFFLNVSSQSSLTMPSPSRNHCRITSPGLQRCLLWNGKNCSKYNQGHRVSGICSSYSSVFKCLQLLQSFWQLPRLYYKTLAIFVETVLFFKMIENHMSVN